MFDFKPLTPLDTLDALRLPGLNDRRNDTRRFTVLLLLMNDVSNSSSEWQSANNLVMSLETGDASESVSMDGGDLVIMGISKLISRSKSFFPTFCSLMSFLFKFSKISSGLCELTWISSLIFFHNNLQITLNFRNITIKHDKFDCIHVGYTLMKWI